MKSSGASPLSDKKILSTKETVMQRISAIVDELIKREETGTFKEEFDKTEFMEHSSKLIGEDGLSPEILASISHDNLKERVEAVMWSQIVAGTLNDLSPEQIKAFDESLKERRNLVRFCVALCNVG
jgi:uncharacterized protein YabN with tetrapyrrole methylase and pyrophosphatase domain